MNRRRTLLCPGGTTSFVNPEAPDKLVHFDGTACTHEAWEPSAGPHGHPNNVPLREWIGQGMGAVSMCWDPRPEGVFDGRAAGAIGDAVVAQVEKKLAEARQIKPALGLASTRELLDELLARFETGLNGDPTQRERTAAGLLGGIRHGLAEPILDYRTVDQ